MTNQSGWTARHLTRRKNEEAEPLIGPLQTEDWHGNRKDTPMPMRLTKGAYFASSKGQD